MKFLTYVMTVLLCMTCAFQATIREGVASPEAENDNRNILILQWSGDYPVAQLDKLPEGQRTAPVGYIADAETFTDVWQVFKPDDKLPEINFSDHLIVFVRNVNFYNRISILRCTLKQGVADVLAMETMSANPIKDKVAMSMAVVERAGLKFLRAGENHIPVTDNLKPPRQAATGPEQACYVIDEQEVCLNNGGFEIEAAPGSASTIKTEIFSRPVYGDLNGNGSDDAAFFMMQRTGGSGIFYYVAAAITINGAFTGTNAVFLGDRISPQTIQIQDGVVIANYADRNAGEPMTTRPSMGVSRYWVVKENRLMETTYSISGKSHDENRQ